MNNEPSVDEFLGFKSRSTCEVARLHLGSDDGSSESCSLSKDPANPYFKAESELQLQRIMLANTPWYNASAEQPGWGDFDEGDLVPARVKITVEVEEIVMAPVLKAKTFDTRDIHPKVAKLYLKRDLELDGKQLVAWYVHRPDGMSLDDMNAWEGQLVYSDKDVWTRRKVYAVCQLPEEYVPEFKGSPGALLIASELC